MKIRGLTILLLALLMSGCSVSANSDSLDPAQKAQVAATPVSHRVAPPTQAGQITREQAEAIALEHAGLTADQVSRLRTEYEVDDGVPRYEVQFRQGRWEYDYEINANTGAIISYDRDE